MVTLNRIISSEKLKTSLPQQINEEYVKQYLNNSNPQMMKALHPKRKHRQSPRQSRHTNSFSFFHPVALTIPSQNLFSKFYTFTNHTHRALLLSCMTLIRLEINEHEVTFDQLVERVNNGKANYCPVLTQVIIIGYDLT
jgi:hypothetical protein